MIYPNGTICMNKLKEMISSKNYNVYFEYHEEEPEGWDWLKDGIYRGNTILISSSKELEKYITKEFRGEGAICYDLSDEYYKKHPHLGEKFNYVKKVFKWEWKSFETNKCYSIEEATYLGEKPKYPTLNLNLFDNDFEDSCIAIGAWDKDSEGYEFRSIGSRMFDYVADEDLNEIWKAIKNADKYLNNRFHNEED